MIDSERRMKFGYFIDRLFWIMLVGIGGFTAHSMNDLNEKVAVVIDHMGQADKRSDAQDKRMDRLEDMIRARF